jgi:hypothetical protein
MTVGRDGLALGAGTLRLDWAELEAVAVHVTTTHPARLRLTLVFPHPGDRPRCQYGPGSPTGVA